MKNSNRLFFDSIVTNQFKINSMLEGITIIKGNYITFKKENYISV